MALLQNGRAPWIIPELCAARGFCEAFVDAFATFSKRNGPTATDSGCSLAFLSSTAALEPLSARATHFFRASARAKGVR